MSQATISRFTFKEVFFGNRLGSQDILREETKVKDVDSYMDLFLKQAKSIRENHSKRMEKGVRDIANKGKKDWIYLEGDLCYLLKRV